MTHLKGIIRFAVCILTLFTIDIQAQTTIRGRVSDSAGGQPVEACMVQAAGQQVLTFSDERGMFSLNTPSSGPATLTFNCIGYASRTIRVDTGFIYVTLDPAPLDLAELVVKGQTDLSRSMTVISKIDLELRPVRSAQDVLRLIPGLFIAQHAGGGKAEQIFLRGFDIDHGTDIRIGVDGMPVNMVSHAHGQGYADLHFLIPETIEKVDFNKGPYYARQGDFCTAGYVDFQTRNALDYSTVKFEAGRFDTYRTLAMLDLTRNNPDHHAYLASELLYSNGPFESPQHFNRINLMGKYHGALDRRRTLTATVSTFSSRWQASGQIPDRAVQRGLISRFGSIDNTEGGYTTRSNANLQLSDVLPNGDYLRQQLFYVRNQFELYSNFTFYLNDPVQGDQIRQTETRDVYGYKLNWAAERSLGHGRLNSDIGLDLRYDQTRGTALSHTRQRHTFLGHYAFGDIDQLDAAVYADAQWKISERWSAGAGLRLDQFAFGYVNRLDSAFQHPVVYARVLSPKLNIVYHPAPGMQLYVKAGQGFHSNDARVVVPQLGREILPRAFGVDLGTFIKPAPRLVLNLAVWGLDLEQEFVYVGDEAVVEPSGKTRRYGVDASVRYQVLRWLFLDADLNYTVPRSKEAPEGENYIPLAPVWSSIGGITTRFERGLNFSLRYRYLADRPANEANTVTAPGYFLLDGGLEFKHRRLVLGLSFENLLNVEWNEAQFDTESRLFDEPAPVSELHYTPGTPFFIKGSAAYMF